MNVSEAREKTASDRRALIIRTLETYLGNRNAVPLVRMRKRLAKPHLMVAGSDIDGVVSAMMLASVSEWRVAAFVMRNGSVRVAAGCEDLPTLTQRSDVYGVDVFSPLFPSVSNHPVLFGAAPRARRDWLRTALEEFDSFILQRCTELGSINLSIWAGIAARLDAQFPQGFPYKYPLGTAQVLLAVLELCGQGPRFYDRQYLPWLVADCDGGLDSIREYHWNVELWWSALAAVVGPASLSEAVYRLALNQRATEFVDVDLRLRRDYRSQASALDANWNLISSDLDTIVKAVELIRAMSGWPDPFLGGVQATRRWKEVWPTRNVLRVSGITKKPRRHVETHLSCAREALHTNFARFPERGTYLGWMLPDKRSSVESSLGRPEIDTLFEEPAAPYPGAVEN